MDARLRLLRFYDIISVYIDFAEIDKTQFKKLNDRYGNERKKKKKKKKRDDQVLKNCYVSIEALSKADVIAVKSGNA